MSIFTETTEQLEQILSDDLDNFESGSWVPDADSIESFAEVKAEIARREVTEPQLYVLTKDDIDACIENREVTAEQRAACYYAVERMDSSPIFEHIDVLIDVTLQE